MTGPEVARSLSSQRDGYNDGSDQTYIAAPLSHGSNPNSNAAGRRREDDVNLAVVPALTSKMAKGTGGPAGDECQNLVWQGGSQQDQIIEEGGVVPTLAHSANTHQGNHQPKVMNSHGVRRLTPTECERLQGLTDIENAAIIEVCLCAPRNADADAAAQCRRSRTNASDADGVGSPLDASSVGLSSASCRRDPASVAPLRVRIVSGEREAEIASVSAPSSGAKDAGENFSRRRVVRDDGFALSLARLTRNVALSIHPGEEASPRSGPCSTPPSNGAPRVRLCGSEITRLAADADAASIIPSTPTTPTTSAPSRIEITESDLETSSLSALRAIAGFIPAETWRESFSISIKSRVGWTFPGADSRRYAGLGDAVTANVAAWIGERLARLGGEA
ncbi:MAG TPA: hypothetical protein PLB01_00175 [Thermoanaerobaculia bacterium]|nr:hypothetical protein [Thermoanaerobaculia bacterium]